MKKIITTFLLIILIFEIVIGNTCQADTWDTYEDSYDESLDASSYDQTTNGQSESGNSVVSEIDDFGLGDIFTGILDGIARDNNVDS